MTRRSSLGLLPLLWLALWLLASCGKDDDYYYPSVRFEFLTAHTGARGQLVEVRTDGGLLLPVAEDASGSLARPDSTLRIVANYELLGDVLAAPTGVKVWAVGSVVSPVPVPSVAFRDGVTTDPVRPLSLWLGLDHLNLVLEVEAQSGVHLFHFVQDSLRVSPSSGACDVWLTLYHDDGGDPQSYARRAYLSVPLRQYAAMGEAVDLHFSINTYSGLRTYDFRYAPVDE